jgi:CubicO group peptidase (beta-lactamase class C family)
MLERDARFRLRASVIGARVVLRPFSCSGRLDGRGWGLGTSVVLDGPWAGATGWDGGLGTSFLLHPARDLVVIVLTQRLFEAAKGPALHTDLQAAALAAAE